MVQGAWPYGRYVVHLKAGRGIIELHRTGEKDVRVVPLVSANSCNQDVKAEVVNAKAMIRS